jgi:hypothetical protein
MPENTGRPKQILGPSGLSLTLDDLPPADVERWVAHRKAAVVVAVRGGLITLQEVAERYGISREEFLSWAYLLDEHGTRGLRATRQRRSR